jgi:glycosyltransferase involved in cell wall biosynthesis
MKILFVNQNMKMGGIAGSLYNALKLLQRQENYEVELAVFDPFFDEKFKDLSGLKINIPFWLKFLYINKKDAWNNLPLWHFFLYFVIKSAAKIIGINKSREYLIKYSHLSGNYDIAVSYSNDIPINNVLVGTNDFVLNSVKAKQKIAWIHNDLDKLGFSRNYVLKRYEKFDKIVNVSEGCKKQLDTMAPELAKRSYYVHNYIDADELEAKSEEFLPFETSQIPVWVTVARIDNQQKRIDRIIETVNRLKNEGYRFQWYVVGSGKDLESLMARSKELQLQNYLIFKGFQKNPYPYVKQADVFILTSDYEAQPLAMMEALIIGTPVITTDFPAAWEFVKPEENGMIVDKSTDGIYQAVKKLFDDKKLLENLKQNAGSNRLNLKKIYLMELKNLFGE